MVVLHREDGKAVELGEVALDELVRLSPPERSVALHDHPLRLHGVVPREDVVAGRVGDGVLDSRARPSFTIAAS
jgi:hypothetical protein